ncbi:cell division and transport-associated protein TolA [Marinomonas alcarazii]|uniref:Cell division and transport-associated protein TolA n=1 Tax=Marinomonas alcarazii TaxID=491949 RepID=A0A318V7Y0_9GAMM|nr:cell envelope integrity protein TolA [Marinomonas alcarazii]PYF84816.1 cell division and transport-associated protein TolA [Marinomonas alcarazii]
MKWLRKDSYGIPIILAVGLHLSIVVAGLLVIDFGDEEQKKPKRPPIVNATVIDISQTIIGKREAEEKAANQRAAALAEQKKKEAEQQKRKEAQRKALEEKEKQLARAKQQAQEKAEAEKKAAEQKREAERQRLAKEAERKRAAEEAEKKRLAEQQAKEKQRKEELARKVEAERQAEEERKRQEEAARLAKERKKAEEAAALAAAEEAKRQAAEAQMVQSISGLINDRVTANWNRPPSARNGMKTYLRIYFLPNGEVRSVDVTRSSGDALFDQKAVDAVYKVGKIDELSNVDSYVFERNFRQVDLIFNPQDLRN